MPTSPLVIDAGPGYRALRRARVRRHVLIALAVDGALTTLVGLWAGFDLIRTHLKENQ